MRNITLSADQDLIEEARTLAKSENSTLNEQFRLWLAAYTRKQRVHRFREVMDELQGKIDTGGRKFSRDEMNER